MDAPLKMQKLQVLGRLFRKLHKSSQICNLKQGGCIETKIIPNSQNIRCFSSNTRLLTQAQLEFNRNIEFVYKCQENDPLKLGIQQEGMFYDIPKKEFQEYLQCTLHREYFRLADVLNSYSLMVRRPALEMINYIQHVDYNKPVVRALFYGRNGCGKTSSLSHVVHYCIKAGYLIVNVRFPSVLLHSCFNYEVSNYNESRTDHPKHAMEWLMNFRSQNSHFLKDLKTSKEYVWNNRESSPAGSTFAELIDFCINRNTYATDGVAVLLKEIKLLACEKKIKVLVSIDGINGLFRKSTLRNENKKLIKNEDITLIRSFKKIIQPDWTNGFIVGTIDELANEPALRGNYTPNFLLGKEGFEHLDPFIPVLVEKYDSKEIFNCLQFYQDRNFLQHPQAKTKKGLDELIFLSDHNPYSLMRFCASR